MQDKILAKYNDLDDCCDQLDALKTETVLEGSTDEWLSCRPCTLILIKHNFIGCVIYYILPPSYA